MHERTTTLVSIITVVFNGEAHLEQTINSVFNQTYPFIEYIIIDGGSTDNTISIIKKYKEKLSYYSSEKDDGIYDAMNKGITQASGDIIGIINSDDFYNNDTISCVVENYNKNNCPDIIHGDMRLIDEKYTIFIKSSIDNLNINMTINHPSCFLRSELYREKMFNQEFDVCADYDLILHHCFNKRKFSHISKVIVNMRTGGVSSDFLKTRREVFFIQKNYYGMLRAFYNFLFSYFKYALSLVLPIKFLLKVKKYTYKI